MRDSRGGLISLEDEAMGSSASERKFKPVPIQKRDSTDQVSTDLL